MDYSPFVKYWLLLGLFLVLMQIVIGGITRLTGSGLSITEWEIVTGTIPPLNEDSWRKNFEKYKGTPQYEKINEGMSLDQFKFIYFWEYQHRLWARFMGFSFIIPFVIFWIRKQIDIYIIKRLFVVIGFAILAAIFGWLMVASGLNDRPWVNAYKLSIHLSIGIAVFLSLLWCILECFYKGKNQSVDYDFVRMNCGLWLLFGLICLQIIFGGIVSGMKAALAFPSWPYMQGVLVPRILLEWDKWNWENIVYYDRTEFAVTLAQFLHRNTAYAISVGTIALIYIIMKRSSLSFLRGCGIIFGALLLLQVILGILTLLHSKGRIPLLYGVLHQAVGVLVISSFFVLHYIFRNSKIVPSKMIN